MMDIMIEPILLILLITLIGFTFFCLWQWIAQIERKADDLKAELEAVKKRVTRYRQESNEDADGWQKADTEGGLTNRYY